jgi:hypothetical protein
VADRHRRARVDRARDARGLVERAPDRAPHRVARNGRTVGRKPVRHARNSSTAASKR